jgi:acetylglutamate kinase
MTLVIKYGGHAMTDPDLRRSVASSIAALAAEGGRPLVVHGGGPFIRSALDEAGLPHGFRATPVFCAPPPSIPNSVGWGG